MLMLSACGKEQKDGNHNHDHSHEAEVTLRAALMEGQEHAHYKAVKQFASEVEAKSEGKIKVNIFESGQLGQEEQLLDFLAKDEDKVDIVIADVTNMKKYEEAIDICQMPFLFKDYEDAREFMDGEIQAEVEENLPNQNMRVLAHYTNGFHCLVTKNKRIDNAKDLQGVLLATSDNTKSELAMKAMAAMTQTVSSGNAKEMLQQGNCEGYEGKVTEIHNNRIYQGQKYLTVTNHTYSASCFVIANSIWESLDREAQEIIETAAVASSYADYNIVSQQQEELLLEIEETGVQVCYPDMKSFWEKAESVVRGYSSVYEHVSDKVVVWKNQKMK